MKNIMIASVLASLAAAPALAEIHQNPARISLLPFRNGATQKIGQAFHPDAARVLGSGSLFAITGAEKKPGLSIASWNGMTPPTDTLFSATTAYSGTADTGIVLDDIDTRLGAGSYRTYSTADRPSRNGNPAVINGSYSSRGRAGGSWAGLSADPLTADWRNQNPLDIPYSTPFLPQAAMPEPGSYALLTAGLSLVGFVVRRRPRTGLRP